MKTTIQKRIGALAVVPALILGLQPATVTAQGTAFTYQGRLESGGAPANGLYDFRFALYDQQRHGRLIGGPVTNAAVAVSNGLFTVLVNFGEGVFTGGPAWLEIGVRPNVPEPLPLPFTTLKELQPVTPTPYAIVAGNVSGVISNSSLPVNPIFSGLVTAGGFAGNGSGLTALNADQLSSGTVPAAALGNAWKIGGNAGTIAGTHFLGTTDAQPLELKVNGQRALRIEPNFANAPNVIGGFAGNYVATGAVGATIGGGGIGGFGGEIAFSNQVLAHFGTVSGGVRNTAGGGYATVGGGERNSGSGPHATVCGGQDNEASNDYATVGGGQANIASAHAATVSGGQQNQANTDYATVSGGFFNIAGDWSATVGGGSFNTAGGRYSIIPGGRDNFATNYAFAAGRRAKANHSGSFVWADATDADIATTGTNSVTFRASGGYRLFSDSGATTGVSLAPGGGSWTSLSDRNAKENFEPVNAREVLEKVAALPIHRWNYKAQDTSIRHIGPNAQDFKAAFDVGETETGITGIDADGVALAAIQGLNRKLAEELQRRDAENAELRRELRELKGLVRSLAAQLGETAR